MYPGTGSGRETVGPTAPDTTSNVPVPAATSGDVYRRAVDEIVVPVAERTAVTWLLLSTGFDAHRDDPLRSEEHTSELQSLMRISYAVFCLKKKNTKHINTTTKIILKFSISNKNKTIALYINDQ